MTTHIIHVDIEEIRISPLRPSGPIPKASPIDTNKARLYGLGVLPSIKVRQIAAKDYELIQGLIAWRAAQALRIDSVDVQILDIDDDIAKEMIFDDFSPTFKKRNPIYEGRAIKELSEIEGITPTRVGNQHGLNRHDVSNLMRILKLSKNLQDKVESGELELGKVKMLLTLPTHQQEDLAVKIIDKKWTTRRVEDEIRILKGGQPKIKKTSLTLPSEIKAVDQTSQDPEIRKEQERLTDLVGSPIYIDHDMSTGHGKVIISYSNLDVFTGIAQRLENKPKPSNDDSDWNERY